MSEEYKRQLLVALKRIVHMQETGQAEVARLLTASLIKHLERYEPVAPAA